MIVIDATNLILGRMASYVAKKALLGEEIAIVNCENSYITGDKKRVFESFKQKRERGVPLQGPYYPRMPDRIVRRAVRGMLPYKKAKGKEAFSRVMCYIGVPEELKEKKAETIKEASIGKVPNLKYVRLGEIARLLGAKYD